MIRSLHLNFRGFEDHLVLLQAKAFGLSSADGMEIKLDVARIAHTSRTRVLDIPNRNTHDIR